MPTNPVTLGSGASDAPGMDPRRTDDTHVAEAGADSYDRDLHDTDLAAGHETRTYSAYDVKELHAAMPDFTNEELKQIPVLAHGERLELSGHYLDLTNLSAGVFSPTPGMEAQDPHRYVAKSKTDYILWNKLTGVDHGGTPAGPSSEA